jgi:hypothetical protein
MKLTNSDNGIFSFYCPGCKHHHCYWTKLLRPGQPVWNFNGDLENPTFSPSLLNAKDDPERRCHLFIKNGKIEYCSDCHHELAGKTIDMDATN